MSRIMISFYFQLSLQANQVLWALDLYERLQVIAGIKSPPPYLDGKVLAEDPIWRLARDLYDDIEQTLAFECAKVTDRLIAIKAFGIDGDPEYAVKFAQAILKRFNLDQVVSFTWSYSSKTPAVDSESGGAMVFNRERFEFLDADLWSDRMAEAMRDQDEEERAKLTQDDPQREYVAGLGCLCPVCKSTDIEGGSVEIDAGTASQEVHCLNCDASWKDLYDLTGFANLDTTECQNEPDLSVQAAVADTAESLKVLPEQQEIANGL